MAQQPLSVAGLANVRDLGGLERHDGTTTPAGVFLRCETLDRVTAEGWGSLRGLGVRTVIDLRRPDERTRSVPDDIDLVAADLDGDEPAFWAPFEADGRWGTPLYYGSHLAELPHRMRTALDAVATARDGAVLFHCGAGWDRTGLLSAVLLRAVDVTADSAVFDYVRSFENADAMDALHGRSSHVEERRGVLDRYGHTPDSAFRAAYDAIELDQWFATAEVAPATRAAIRTWRGAIERAGTMPPAGR